MSKPNRSYITLSEQQRRFILKVISYIEKEVRDGSYNLKCWNDEGKMMHSIFRSKKFMIEELNKVVRQGKYEDGIAHRVVLQCIRYHIVGGRQPFTNFLK